MSTVTDSSFDQVSLEQLLAMPNAALDALPFGVIGIDRDGVCQLYSRKESELAGLEPETVLGTLFFDTVGQCMNNFMVAQRFEDEPTLDEIVPYVLTLRMRPTRVRLRLLASPQVPLRLVLIER